MELKQFKEWGMAQNLQKSLGFSLNYPFLKLPKTPPCCFVLLPSLKIANFSPCCFALSSLKRINLLSFYYSMLLFLKLSKTPPYCSVSSSSLKSKNLFSVFESYFSKIFNSLPPCFLLILRTMFCYSILENYRNEYDIC